ncbi:MAG: glycosyltransferase 87 family protein [Microbacteriaceae bacterium]
MTTAAASSARGARTVRSLATNRFVLWCFFVLVHLWLGLLNLFGPNLPMGDVTIVYKFWVEQAVAQNFWVGIDSVWVYPIVAMVPMLAAFSFGPALYASTWLSIVMALNAVAFAVITGWSRSKKHSVAAWWWLGFLVALGPIALGRIDSITVPLALVGMLMVATRPVAATVVMTIATWVKVWPAALLAAIVITLARRRDVVSTAVVVSLTIVAIALVFGSGTNVLSFFTQQTGRGLQVEAPISTIWMWFAVTGTGGSQVYYDPNILTYQVRGTGTELASAVMTPILGVVSLLVCGLGVIALRRGVHPEELLPVLSLALVTVLIAFNKVGSPQFVMWFAVPVIFGLVSILKRRKTTELLDSEVPGAGGRMIESVRVPATLVIVIAALTQFIYPFLYTELLNLNTVMLVALTIRNGLYFVLLAWTLAELVYLCGRRASWTVPSNAETTSPLEWLGR